MEQTGMKLSMNKAVSCLTEGSLKQPMLNFMEVVAEFVGGIN